jgi:hypothetical protein
MLFEKRMGVWFSGFFYSKTAIGHSDNLNREIKGL